MRKTSPGHFIDYEQYIDSPEWWDRAADAMHRAGYRCQVCHADRFFCRLEVHHNTYERLGRERPEDLVVLCAHCHDLFHRFGKMVS